MADGTNRGELAIGGLDAMPDVVARLETRRWPRVADLGCGRGEAALATAAEFWDVLVDGFDSDAACLAEARRRATEAALHATAVGFAGVEELPLEHRSLRLVRLSA
jgi:trans-aconitate methyltransferase